MMITLVDQHKFRRLRWHSMTREAFCLSLSLSLALLSGCVAGQVPAIQRGRHLRITIKDLVRVKRLVGNSSQPPDGG